MRRQKRSGVSVIARGEAVELTREARNASIAARYGRKPQQDYEYTVGEWAEAADNMAYATAQKKLVEMVKRGEWQRRKLGNKYLYWEVVRPTGD